LTGMPAEIRPVAVRIVPTGVIDNGTGYRACVAEVAASGLITFFAIHPTLGIYTTGQWTAGGTKGFTSGWHISYPISV